MRTLNDFETQIPTGGELVSFLFEPLYFGGIASFLGLLSVGAFAHYHEMGRAAFSIVPFGHPPLWGCMVGMMGGAAIGAANGTAVSLLSILDDTW